MNKIISILMKRDGLTLENALKRIKECQKAIKGGNKNAMKEILNLDDCYIFELMG